MAQGSSKETDPKEEKDGKSKFSKDGFKRLFGVFRYTLPYKWVFLIGMFFLVGFFGYAACISGIYWRNAGCCRKQTGQ